MFHLFFCGSYIYYTYKPQKSSFSAFHKILRHIFLTFFWHKHDTLPTSIADKI
nr:MAG TPA: hypothetical protein [Caudoviricetes sp.]